MEARILYHFMTT